MPALPDSALDVPSGSDPALDVQPGWLPGVPPSGSLGRPALPPPPASPQKFSPPVSFTASVSPADYPPESFRLGEQGIVRSRFLLTETGEATECAIDAPSNYPRLDEAACGLVRRWQYEARTETGKAIASYVTVNLVFSVLPPARPRIAGDFPSIPQPAAAIAERFTPAQAVNGHAVTANDFPADSIRMQEQGRIGLVFIVNEAGDVSECAVVSSSGYPRLDAAARAMVINRWKYKPAVLDGRPTAILVTANVVYQIGDDPICGKGATSTGASRHELHRRLERFQQNVEHRQDRCRWTDRFEKQSAHLVPPPASR